MDPIRQGEDDQQPQREDGEDIDRNHHAGTTVSTPAADVTTTTNGPPQFNTQKQKQKWEEKQNRLIMREEKTIVEKRKKLISKDPNIQKLQDALEHVIVVGSKVRRDNWRRSMYENQSDNMPVDKISHYNFDADLLMSTNRRRRTAISDTTFYLHAEDIRIYGNNDNGPHKPSTKGFAMSTWPSRPNNKKRPIPNTIAKVKYDDTEWNLEHGDSIPPVLFNLARLSQEHLSDTQEQILNNVPASMKSLITTNITLDEKDVPRALLLHCWEKAVHAASNGIFAAATTTTTTASNIVEDQQPANSNELEDETQNFLANRFKDCETKCHALGLNLDLTKDTRICPRCTREFETQNELSNHYYGNNDIEGGCSWPLIRSQQLESINHLLQHHVTTQLDQILNIVMSQVASDNVDGSDDDNTASNQQQKNVYDWEDVRNFLQNALTVNSASEINNESATPSAKRRKTAPHPILETIQTTYADKFVNPLVLNPMIMEVLSRRLIDRYANLPR